MPRILAFDTSAPGVSAAYFDGAKTHARSDSGPARHSESLFAVLESLLASRKASLAGVDAFAVGLGPGSFTGLRVGLACAKALAYSLDKKLIGISSLHAVYAAHGEDKLRVAQDGKRGTVFAASFAGGRATVKPAALKTEEFLRTLERGDRVAGTALAFCKNDVERIAGPGSALGTPETWRPLAENLIPEALRRFAEKRFDDPMSLAPEYLFDQTCTVTLPNPRKRPAARKAAKR